jgi:pimeloyl-ACP methyl ester carboxylesterase
MQPERRRIFGEVAAIEFGPATRPLDVLFLHANGFNALTYRQALTCDLRVLAVDLRGHGRTKLPTTLEAHGWHVYAEDLLTLLASLGEQPRILAGHSMGATTALLAAPRLPPDLRLLLFDPVLAAPAAYGTAPDWDQPLARAAARRKTDFATRAEALDAYRGRGAFRTWPDSSLADYLQDGLRPTQTGGFTLACAPSWEAANFACYGVSDPYPGLAAAAHRVRVLRAEQQSTCFLTEEAVPGLALETVAGTTHFLPIECPATVHSALHAAA